LPAADNVRFDPIRYFSAPTEGIGTIHKLVGGSVPLRVSSRAQGNLDRLSLVQTIREGAKPPRERIWIIQRVGDGRYAASLTDATGPVSVTVRQGSAHVRYTMKGGLLVDQQLALQTNAMVICNRLTVRKFGIVVAWVNETIRRLPIGRNAPDTCPW
jgi:hypothetical protein